MIENINKEEKRVLLQKSIRGLLSDSRLNDWEKEFLSSISKQLAIRSLSEKQLHILNKIRRKCENSDRS
jgi:hypothetical protein